MPATAAFERLAVYYAPPEGSALAAFAAAWLSPLAAGPDIAAWVPDAERVAITEPARRYGFHGTLMAPFRLAEGARLEDLDAAVARLAAASPPVRAGPLQLTAIGPFLALCPSGDQDALGGLAARIVRDLDAFRAPLSEEERARRGPERLTPRQGAHLARWGYPYVLEEFRFHLTLTGALAGPLRDDIAARLGPLVAPLSAAPFEVAEICVFGDPGAGRPFALVSRHGLGR